MAVLKKGHNFVSISRIALKSESAYLNINPKSFSTYQYPGSSGSQDMLTRFLCPATKTSIPFEIISQNLVEI